MSDCESLILDGPRISVSTKPFLGRTDDPSEPLGENHCPRGLQAIRNNDRDRRAVMDRFDEILCDTEPRLGGGAAISIRISGRTVFGTCEG